MRTDDKIQRYQQIIEKRLQHPRQRAWEYKAEIAGFDIGFHCKEVQFSLFDLKYEETAIGGLAFNSITGQGLRRLSMTCEIDEKGELQAYLQAWKSQISFADGTFGVLDEYSRELILTPLDLSGKEREQPYLYDVVLVRADTSFASTASKIQELKLTFMDCRSQP